MFSDSLAQVDRAIQGSILADSVTYAPGVGPPVTVKGCFDALSVLVPTGHGEVSSFGPAVFLRLADLPEDPAAPSGTGPTITVAGVAYAIRDVNKDGQGGVRILLHLAA